MTTSKCNKCKETKPFDDFNYHPGAKDGCQSWCKACNRERKQTPKYKEGERRGYLRRAYGITDEQFDGMMEAQDFKCTICREPFDLNNTKDIHVDHCHSSNRLREILCPNCNLGLGSFKDNPDALRRAALYIERYR